MIRTYVVSESGLRLSTDNDGRPSLADALWIDLISPTDEEDALVERTFGLTVPSYAEMRDIETSSRLFEENGALYMTATVATQLDSARPESTAVTFILNPASNRLITVRFCEPLPFQRYVAFAETHPASAASAVIIFEGLLDRIIERKAEVIERIATHLDQLSAEVFSIDRRHDRASTRDLKLREALRGIGVQADLLSKSRESIVSLGRLATFVHHAGGNAFTPETLARIGTSERDMQALADHASFVSGKLNFLLDATLGYINIEQNGIIKIFSVAAVVFMPPTLIASIYGMNFETMPELHWLLGYPFALVMMVVAAVVPYVYFNRKGWL